MRITRANPTDLARQPIQHVRGYFRELIEGNLSGYGVPLKDRRRIAEDAAAAIALGVVESRMKKEPTHAND